VSGVVDGSLPRPSAVEALRDALARHGIVAERIEEGDTLTVLLDGLPSPVSLEARGHLAVRLVHRRTFGALHDPVVGPGDCGFPLAWSERTGTLRPEWPPHVEVDGERFDRVLQVLRAHTFHEDIASRRSLLVRERATGAAKLEVTESVYLSEPKHVSDATRAVMALLDALR
jgi:hypothetical protein